MSDKLTTALKAHESEWGTEIEEFSVISCVPTAECQQIVAADATLKIRLKALRDELGEGELFRYPQLAPRSLGSQSR